MRNGTTPFRADDFLGRLAAYVREHPAMAPRAYASAAHALRVAAARPENHLKKLQLQVLAQQIDLLAAEAVLPAVDPDSERIEESFSDYPGIRTEWDVLVEDHEASQADEEGNPTDTIVAEAIRQERQKERERDEGAFPVRVTPPSIKDETLLGSQALVQWGGAPGSGSFVSTTGVSGAVVAVPEANVVRWDGFPKEAMACTVCARRVAGGGGGTFPTATSGANTLIYRPYGHLTWGGDRGEPNEAYFDVGRGTQISVSANYLYLSVGMDPPPSGAFAAGSMVLGGSLGFLSASRPAKVYRTRYLDSIAAAGSSTIVIPLFATTIEAFVGINPSNWTVQVQRLGGGVLGIYTPGNPALPLANEAYQVVCTNNGGAADSAEIVFGLSL